jgi:hypothetical protein
VVSEGGFEPPRPRRPLGPQPRLSRGVACRRVPSSVLSCVDAADLVGVVASGRGDFKTGRGNGWGNGRNRQTLSRPPPHTPPARSPPVLLRPRAVVGRILRVGSGCDGQHVKGSRLEPPTSWQPQTGSTRVSYSLLRWQVPPMCVQRDGFPFRRATQPHSPCLRPARFPSTLDLGSTESPDVRC